MNEHELKALIRLVEESEIDELEIRRWGRTVRIVKNSRPGSHAVTAEMHPARPAAGAGPAPVEATPSAPAERTGLEIPSPMVGTFYRAPAPEAPPFVEVGDKIRPGQTLCILEAMKLMNELQAEVSGTLRTIMIENGQPVEYGQVLFVLDP